MAFVPKHETIRQLRLPTNRWQSFFDCVVNKTSTTLLLGLFVFIFSIPLLLVLGISNILVYDITMQISEGLITEAGAATRIFDTLNAANLLLIPSLVVLFIGLSGLTRVTRRMIFQEHIAFIHDFKQGVSSNWASFSLLAIALGILHFVMMLLARLGYFWEAASWLDVTLAIGIGALVLTFLITPFVLFQTDLYNLSFGGKLKNSFLLGMRTAPVTLPFMLAIFSPWLLLLIRYDGVGYFIVIGLLFMMAAPLQFLAIHEYTLSVLDKFVNKTNHPEIYDKGIYRHAHD
ncbi:MAG TPA: hypothetical protein PK340_02180 [Bacilli bacterium]|nr:hypothetical protein [Bacilli bacterium]